MSTRRSADGRGQFADDMNVDAKRRETWARALGRFSPEQKARFIEGADALLSNMRKLQSLQPQIDHVRALSEVADRAEALERALARAARLQLPENYIRNAWRQAGAHDGAPSAYPQELPASLARLAAAARLWIHDPQENPAQRSEEAILREFGIVGLMEEYKTVFGSMPTFGTNSPFYKFCREAFPDYGFKAPSPDKLRDPVGIGRKTPKNS